MVTVALYFFSYVCLLEIVFDCMQDEFLRQFNLAIRAVMYFSGLVFLIGLFL